MLAYKVSNDQTCGPRSAMTKHVVQG